MKDVKELFKIQQLQQILMKKRTWLRSISFDCCAFWKKYLKLSNGYLNDFI